MNPRWYVCIKMTELLRNTPETSRLLQSEHWRKQQADGIVPAASPASKVKGHFGHSREYCVYV